MKISPKSFTSFTSRLLAWNKHLRIAATAAVVGLVSLSVMLMAQPDNKRVTLSPAKTTTGQNPKPAQAKDAPTTVPAAETTTSQPTQSASKSVPAQTTATQSTPKATAPTAKPQDTSTEMPKAVVHPLDPTTPSPFYDIVIGSGAVDGDSVNIAFYVVPHNNPATNTSASIVWIDTQGQAPDYVYIRDVHMTSSTTGVLVLGLSGNYPKNFTVTLVVNSSNGMGSLTIPFSI